MWRPWMPVAADPHAPGFDQWKEQASRAKEVPPASSARKSVTAVSAQAPTLLSQGVNGILVLIAPVPAVATLTAAAWW